MASVDVKPKVSFPSCRAAGPRCDPYGFTLDDSTPWVGGVPAGSSHNLIAVQSSTVQAVVVSDRVDLSAIHVSVNKGGRVAVRGDTRGSLAGACYMTWSRLDNEVGVLVSVTVHQPETGRKDLDFSLSGSVGLQKREREMGIDRQTDR